MTTIRILGQVDAERRLTATVPSDVPTGQVEVVVIVPPKNVDTPDPSEHLWESGIAVEWREDLADVRQDIYTLADGTAIDEAR